MKQRWIFLFNPILPGEGGRKIRPLLFFLHHPKTAQGIKLKLSDFKDTPLRHILQVKPVHWILSCCHGNKITEGTSQDLAPRKSEKSAICKDIKLKFGIETNFGPLSSKTNINFQSDINLTFLAFRPFCRRKHRMTSLWHHTSKFNKFWNWNQKIIPSRLYMPNFMLLG